MVVWSSTIQLHCHVGCSRGAPAGTKGAWPLTVDCPRCVACPGPSNCRSLVPLGPNRMVNLPSNEALNGLESTAEIGPAPAAIASKAAAIATIKDRGWFIALLNANRVVAKYAGRRVAPITNDAC